MGWAFIQDILKIGAEVEDFFDAFFHFVFTLSGPFSFLFIPLISLVLLMLFRKLPISDYKLIWMNNFVMVGGWLTLLILVISSINFYVSDNSRQLLVFGLLYSPSFAALGALVSFWAGYVVVTVVLAFSLKEAKDPEKESSFRKFTRNELFTIVIVAAFACAAFFYYQYISSAIEIIGNRTSIG